MLFAREGKLEAWERRSPAAAGTRPSRRQRGCRRSTSAPIEPFGFADGISQPQIDWNCELTLDGREQLEFGNVLALGEVLLGYRNEYGLLHRAARARPGLRRRGRATCRLRWTRRHRRDLGRNGSYLVFRQLEQDVAGFWRFVDEQAGGDAQRRWALAEPWSGRHRGRARRWSRRPAS